MYIISGVTRRLSREYPDRLIVTLDRSNGNIYLRRKDLDLDLSPLIKLAQERGFNAGGKEEVVGIILPGSYIDSFLADLISKEDWLPSSERWNREDRYLFSAGRAGRCLPSDQTRRTKTGHAADQEQAAYQRASRTGPCPARGHRTETRFHTAQHGACQRG